MDNALAAFTPLEPLREAWKERRPAEKLRRLRSAAQQVRDRLLSGGPVDALATCPLVTFPYPTGFAFSGAALSPAPYVMMTNRMQVVQFWSHGERKTLLFNPSDYDAADQTPFFAVLKQRFSVLPEKWVKRRHGTVQSHLAALGLRPEHVDYIAYDHLHTQDVRAWLGGEGQPGFLPNAKLLVMRDEWVSAKDLHPFQAGWYVPGGTAISDDRVVLLEGDLQLGQGVALLSTPGHTAGNMSLAVMTDSGLFVVSENGVATECYTPLQSRIGGVRAHAEHLGLEVVMNGNTREGTLDQYSSMIVEKIIAGPSRVDPSYVNFYPSSELTASPIAPLLTPTFSHAEISHGHVVPPVASSREPKRAVG